MASPRLSSFIQPALSILAILCLFVFHFQGSRSLLSGYKKKQQTGNTKLRTCRFRSNIVVMTLDEDSDDPDDNNGNNEHNDR